MFNYVIESLGKPERPLPDEVDFSDVPFAKLSNQVRKDIGAFDGIQDNFSLTIFFVSIIKFSCSEKSPSFWNWTWDQSGESLQRWRKSCTETIGDQNGGWNGSV